MRKELRRIVKDIESGLASDTDYGDQLILDGCKELRKLCKENWSKELPTKPGWYFLYGERFKGHKPTLEMIQVVNIANGVGRICGASFLFESEMGECWFYPVEIPKLPDLTNPG